MVIQNLTTNFSGNVRHERIGGRDYIVAPIVMIVPGVLPGSQGALLYEEEDVRISAPHWDNVILTNGHLPVGTNGKLLKVREQFGMGFIQNAHYKNGKLRGEGWFDVMKTQRINRSIYDALITNRKIEVSTGLHVDFVNSSGVWNGRHYNRIAKNYRPDHLAILMDERGACGLDVGCGCNVNNDGHENCLCSSCLNQMSKLFQSELGHRDQSKVLTPAGGCLDQVAIDWSQVPIHTQQPTPAQQPSYQRYESDGPAGGPLHPTLVPEFW